MAVNDAANNKLYSETKIHIIVLDLNDNAPRFDKLIYNGKVKENAALNTSVMRVTAHDLDEVGTFLKRIKFVFFIPNLLLILTILLELQDITVFQRTIYFVMTE